MSHTHLTTALALLLAFASTTLVSLAYLREHAAVGELPVLSLRRPLGSVRALLSSRAWLVGFAMESTGFAMYVVALALAPLALVQSVAAGGIGILAVASARLGHRRLTKRERLGAGVSVAACKIRGIRAATVHDTYTAHQSVEHDNLNVLCLGGRVVGTELAAEIIAAFLAAEFSGAERHVRRLAKVAEIEITGGVSSGAAASPREGSGL